MTKFKKVIATAEAKVAKAEAEAFAARLEAIEAILQNASEYDVLMLCARVLATVVPDCCDKHQEPTQRDEKQQRGRNVQHGARGIRFPR